MKQKNRETALEARTRTHTGHLGQTQTYQRRLTSAVHGEDQKHSDKEEGENGGQTRGSPFETLYIPQPSCAEELLLSSCRQ